MMGTTARVHALFVASAFVLAYARLILDADKYLWESFGTLAIAWLVNYLGMVLVSAFGYAAIKVNESRFLNDARRTHEFTVEEVVYVVAMVTAVGSIALVLGTHYVPSHP